MGTRMLTRAEVQHRAALSKTSLYRLMSAGAFPRPRRVGTRCVRWIEAEINEFLESRPRANGDHDRAA